mmetsp:Transcript_47079/g.87449  ORF Transcript_47079/g.87449 Transcript_47079/m.87449 type:complete len:174 (-) Transcript_47079:48-569(-)
MLLMASFATEARLFGSRWQSSSSSDDIEEGRAFEGCPEFNTEYNCQKTDGTLPQFFQGVKIKKADTHYKFTTKVLPGLPIDELKTEYHTDRVIRLGSDNHYPDDGAPLENLPSHETSFCENGVLVRSEMTFFPDNSVAQEQITMHVNDQEELVFELVVDGALALKASCSATTE